jgi:hypothetical protein
VAVAVVGFLFASQVVHDLLLLERSERILGRISRHSGEVDVVTNPGLSRLVEQPDQGGAFESS